MADFITRLAPIAQKYGAEANVLPSIIIAQGVLESASGTSELAVAANNLFGIKKGMGWDGPVYPRDSAEWSEEQGWYSVISEFRKYDSIEDCVADLVDKYLTMPRYSAILFDRDPFSVADKLLAAGYATDPTYPEKLKNIIVRHGLEEYDTIKGELNMVTIKKQLAPQSVINAVTSGHKNNRRFITIHETANTSRGAGAQAHANLQSNGNSRAASWHYQVDDKLIIQSFEHTVSTWQAGDGGGNGNMNSISIEICVNVDSVYAIAVKNAWELVRHIMAVEGIPLSNVKQHHFWSGKNCPAWMRAGNRGINWATFLNNASRPSVVQISSPVAPSLPAKGFYQQGDTGTAIGHLQASLTLLGHTTGVDNIFGPATRTALIAFQRKVGITADGIYGAQSLAAMRKALEDLKAPAPSPINYYVRKSWADSGSQIGAFNLLAGAKAMADLNNGYSVYDKNGKLVHPIPVATPDRPTYSMKESERLGEIEMIRDWPYRVLPDNSSEVISTLKAGHKAHYYEIRGDFYRLGQGWVYKSTLKVTVNYADEAARKKAEEAEAKRIAEAQAKAKAEAEKAKREMEEAIRQARLEELRKDFTPQNVAIVINSEADYPAAQVIHLATGYPIYERAGLFDRKIATTVIGVGGTADALVNTIADEVIMVSGRSRHDTLEEAKKYANSL